MEIEKTNSKGKHWCITIFNYEEDGVPKFETMDLQYYVYGYEICPTTQRKHLQVYIVYKQDMRFNALKKIFGKNSRIFGKSKWSTPKQASDYCKEDGNFIEGGILPEKQSTNGGEATKRKWQEAKDNAIKGNLDDICPKIFVQNYNTLLRIKSDYAKVPDDLNWAHGDPPNIWVYGSTGTGKSRYIRDNPLYKGLFIKPLNKWWNNYQNEPYVLIEDIGKEHACLGSHLKIWADRYGFRAEDKFGTRVLRPQAILITSNYHPNEIWIDNQISEPLERRFKFVYLEKVYVYKKIIDIDTGDNVTDHVNKKRKIDKENSISITEEYSDDISGKEIFCEKKIKLNKTSVTIPK